MQVVLVMFRPDGQRRSFSVTREVTVIGRREDCDLRIPLSEVSRKHCRLVKDGDTVRLEDLGSSNGTFHNGERVREAELQPGDALSVGPVAFTIQINGVPADEELQPATDGAATFSALPTQEYVAPGGQGQDKLGDMASVITDVQEAARTPRHSSDDVEALQALGDGGEEAAAELEPVEELEEVVEELEPIEEEASASAEEVTADELVELQDAETPADEVAGEELAELEPVEEESPAEAVATEQLVELEEAEESEAEQVSEELAELEPLEEAGEVAAQELEPLEGELVEDAVDETPIAIEHEEDPAPVVSAQEMTEPEDAATLEAIEEGDLPVVEEAAAEQDDFVDIKLHDSRHA